MKRTNWEILLDRSAEPKVHASQQTLVGLLSCLGISHPAPAFLKFCYSPSCLLPPHHHPHLPLPATMSEKHDIPEQPLSKEGNTLTENHPTTPLSRTSSKTPGQPSVTAVDPTDPSKPPNPDEKVYLTGVKLVLVFVYAPKYSTLRPPDPLNSAVSSSPSSSLPSIR
jgi:hypothetical protein